MLSANDEHIYGDELLSLIRKWRQNMATEYILDREELETRLKNLAETPYTGELSRGANCYLMVGPDDEDYVCVICGKSTEYRGFSYTNKNISKIREIIDKLKSAGIDVFLDEREYCEYCSEQRDESDRYWIKEGLILNIRFDSEKPYHQVKSISIPNYLCLSSFLLGKDTFCGTRDEVYSLHDNIDIVCKMTGLGKAIINEWADCKENIYPGFKEYQMSIWEPRILREYYLIDKDISHINDGDI